MATSTLLTPIKIGALSLKHRVVMAPLTRMRAGQPGNVPRALNANYYAQRATHGGFIIAEAAQITPEGQGYPATPGIHSDEQVRGWREVTSAVHAQGGLIALQLWHVGRISHSSFQPRGVQPVAPSAVATPGAHFTASWTQAPFETPRALRTEEIRGIVDAYRNGARRALEAGFDGVEIHGANGYLIEQFLQSRTNRRTDRYGGSIPNRVRFLEEVTRAVIDVAGADCVGVRLSPFGHANHSGEDEPEPLYRYALQSLAKLDIAYLHLIEPRSTGTGKADVSRPEAPSASKLFRADWPGVLIAAGGYDRESAERTIASGQADAVAFGRAFISTPDLVERVRRKAPFNPWNRATFYGGEEAGYTDYPRLESH
jgi:N-ethylmaleimide reductase